MALRQRQKQFYIDTADVYRQPRANRGASGNFLPATKVINGLIGKFFTEPNYDTHMSPAGQQKQQNIMTSDRWHCDAGTDVREGDWFNITNGLYSGTWRKVADVKNVRLGLANYMEVFLAFDIAPNHT